MEYLSPKLLEAFEFSAIAHRDQLRKDPNKTPYFSHPAAVALVIARAGFSEEVIIAALLHDVIEDTVYTAEDIRKRFGNRVVELVLGVTENANLSWKERKQQYNQHLQNADFEIKALSAADLIANRQSRLDMLRKGIDPWKYFEDQSADYARRVLENDDERMAMIKHNFEHPLLEELSALLQETKKLTSQ